MKIKVQYVGTTSSGRMHKYALVIAALMAADSVTVEKTEAQVLDETITALKAEGVTMNQFLGDRTFLSSTHLHTIPTIGNQIEVNVKGYHDGATDRDVNYFADIDKTAQRAFAQRQLINQQVGEIVMVEGAFAAAGSATSVETFEKIKLLKAQQALVNKQAQAIVLAD